MTTSASSPEHKYTYEDLGDQFLEGRIVLLKSDVYYGSDEDRHFKCMGGFGCASRTRGTAVIGEFVGGKNDGRKTRVERYEIDKVVSIEV